MQARIEALENDGNTAEDFEAAGSDDEYQMEESDEGWPLQPIFLSTDDIVIRYAKLCEDTGGLKGDSYMLLWIFLGLFNLFKSF